MPVGPDSQQPSDDDRTVGPEEQTANIDRSFDRSLPPAAKSAKKAQSDSTSEEQIDDEAEQKATDRTTNYSGAQQPGKPISSGKTGLDLEPSMSILQTERTIARRTETSPKERDSTEKVDDSVPETAEDVNDHSYPIGRYQVRRLLGQGAFGRVYEAHDPQLDRRVAVKVSKDLKGRDEVDRFLREARSAAHLRHPTIIPVYEYGQVDDLSMIVYELVDGETLRAYIKRKAPLDLSETITIIRKIAEGLDYAHKEGIIHRDVKPDNVLIDKKGEPHIADFGCARRSDDQDMHATIEGSILGTPMYMSPEQASGRAHRADGRTDVWSLGVMLYEMVSGDKPFKGKLSDLLHLIRHHDPKPLRKIHPSTPRDIETICSKCLRRELDQRFATAGELADELERFERGEPIVSRRISLLNRTWLWAKRNRAVASLLTAVVVSLLVGLTFSLGFLFKAKYEYNERARAALNQLTTAESSALDDILLGLEEWPRSTMLKKIRENLGGMTARESEPDGELAADNVEIGLERQEKRLRLNIALLHLREFKEEPEYLFADDAIENTIADLLSADGQELVSFGNACTKNEKVMLSIRLWQKLGIGLEGERVESKESNERRFRVACALAQLQPESSNWAHEVVDVTGVSEIARKNIAWDVADYLSAMNLDEVQQWLPTVVPIRELIKPKLEEIFVERERTLDDAGPETAAEILSFMINYEDNDKDRDIYIDYIVKTLVTNADARQLARLLPALESRKQYSGERLLQQLAANDVVTEKANLILALIQLDHPSAWRELDRQIADGTGNSVSTEVIELWGPASSSVGLLIEKIKLWKESDVKADEDALAVVLLALGQFTDGQIPYSIKRELILSELEWIFINHNDARVHSCARWLMTEWDFENEMRAAEASIPRTEEPARGKNWHVDMSGNTFVVFDEDDFKMNKDEDDDKYRWDWPFEGKPHRFGICIHEVTSEQFAKFADSLPENDNSLLDNRTYDKSKKPVAEVRFYWALAYCRWLTDKYPQLDHAVRIDVDKLISTSVNWGYKDLFDLNQSGYRLPTVAEWDFACRASTNTKRSFGISDERLDQYAWYSSNSENDRHPVAQLKPNEAGLFDMLGNVSERCLDLYLNKGKLEKRRWESRGGSYLINLNYVHSMTRRSVDLINFSEDVGFRLARTYPPAGVPDPPGKQDEQPEETESDSSDKK